MPYFKAFIRVVKSLRNDNGYDYFGDVNIVDERLIEAADKNEVKSFLIEKYPQFFPTNKVYEKETKDTTQFFYVVIYPLYQHEVNLINEGKWCCSNCGQEYPNKYINRPYVSQRLFGDKMFCENNYGEDSCFERYKKDIYKDMDYPDDTNYIKKDSPNYIYKVTEKSSGKCYIGKTRNEPFFRWWNHLKHSSSPFGIYLRSTKISDWTFEVLEILPAGFPDTTVFDVESKYIVKFDSINNGYNTLISKRQSVNNLIDDNVQQTLF